MILCPPPYPHATCKEDSIHQSTHVYKSTDPLNLIAKCAYICSPVGHLIFTTVPRHCNVFFVQVLAVWGVISAKTQHLNFGCLRHILMYICPFILMYNMHSDVYAVYIWSHSDVHSTFGCMSVILMYTLHFDVWKSF